MQVLLPGSGCGIRVQGRGQGRDRGRGPGRGLGQGLTSQVRGTGFRMGPGPRVDQGAVEVRGQGSRVTQSSGYAVLRAGYGSGYAVRGQGSGVGGRGSGVEGRGSRVEGRGSRVRGRGSGVGGRGSRVGGRGSGVGIEGRGSGVGGRASGVGVRILTRTSTGSDRTAYAADEYLRYGQRTPRTGMQDYEYFSDTQIHKDTRRISLSCSSSDFATNLQIFRPFSCVFYSFHGSREINVRGPHNMHDNVGIRLESVECSSLHF